jgi:hypothetical protein
MKQNIQLSDIKNTACAHLNEHLWEKPQDSAKKPQKKAKYNNVKVEFDGKVFDSMKERDRYISLRYLVGTGDITELECQVSFRLESDDKKICDYVADFVYRRNGEMIVEDVKSAMTRRLAVYRLKKKLLLAQYKIEIKEI